MKKILIKIWSNRAFRTFLQGFIGVFAGTQLFDLKNIDVVKTLIISGIMAGISAVMSLNTGEEKFRRTNTEETIPMDEETEE